MARVRYTEIVDRFGHIDARFVACTLGFPAEGSFLRVAFYPWWEHPRYLAARRDGTYWSIQDLQAGAREVTVYPIDLVGFAISQADEVGDWQFTDAHWCLWDFQARSQLFLNELVDREALVARVAQHLGVDRSRVRGLLHPFDPAPWTAPMALTLPRAVRDATIHALRDLGVAHLGQPSAETEGLVALVLDDTDYLVARDFELDVPEFEHRDEWFSDQPR